MISMVKTRHNPSRSAYFRTYKLCRFHGYLSPAAKRELEVSGNDVIRVQGCWIIKAKEESS